MAMGNVYSGGLAGSASQYPGAQLSEKPREQRIIENQIHSANRMIECANGIMAHMDDLRGRLLGISEPNTPPSNRDNEPKLGRAELPELSTLLERLEQQLGAIANKLGDLQRI